MTIDGSYEGVSSNDGNRCFPKNHIPSSSAPVSCFPSLAASFPSLPPLSPKFLPLTESTLPPFKDPYLSIRSAISEKGFDVVSSPLHPPEVSSNHSTLDRFTSFLSSPSALGEASRLSVDTTKDNASRFGDQPPHPLDPRDSTSQLVIDNENLSSTSALSSDSLAASALLSITSSIHKIPNSTPLNQVSDTDCFLPTMKNGNHAFLSAKKHLERPMNQGQPPKRRRKSFWNSCLFQPPESLSLRKKSLPSSFDKVLTLSSGPFPTDTFPLSNLQMKPSSEVEEKLWQEKRQPYDQCPSQENPVKQHQQQQQQQQQELWKKQIKQQFTPSVHSSLSENDFQPPRKRPGFLPNEDKVSNITKNIRQCQGTNRKRGIRCKNAALMEYIGPQPAYCAQHIELDQDCLYEKCRYWQLSGPREWKACKEIVLKEFGYCYKHFGCLLNELTRNGNPDRLLELHKRVLELLAQLRREASTAKKSDVDLYQRKNKLIAKFQQMKKHLSIPLASAFHESMPMKAFNIRSDMNSI